VFSDIPDKYKKEIESAGIQIKDGFRHEIERWRKLNHSSKNAILDILENQTSPWAKRLGNSLHTSNIKTRSP